MARLLGTWIIKSLKSQSGSPIIEEEVTTYILDGTNLTKGKTRKTRTRNKDYVEQ
ncbi:MAG: hypothetical protein HQM08_25645 [Candidatus Riflebacteria bacterium]|nr:hypothetical protein [Candidatus Riflebacteria bacterium]